MAKRPTYRSRYKAPVKYSADTLERTIRGVYDDMNRLSGDLGSARDDLGRATLQITEGTGQIGDLFVQGYVEWFQFFDTQLSAEMAEGRLVVTERSYDPAAELARYIREDEGNIKDTSTWLPITGGDIVTDPLYPLGGYYRVRTQIPTNTDEHGLLTLGMQLRVDGATWIEDYMRFDIDREPKVRTMSLAIGTFKQVPQNSWPLYASITCDEDTGSFAFAVSTTPFPPDPDDIGDGLFTYGITDGRQGTNIFLSDFLPSPIGSPGTVYVVARAYRDASTLGGFGRIIGRSSIVMPYDITDPSLIGDGRILAGQIEAISQNYWVDIKASHSGTPATIINIDSARITWADGFTVNLPFHTLNVSTDAGLWYVYFQYSASPTQLIATQNKSTATAAGPRKVFIGIAQRGDSFIFESAWWVFASDEPVISAAWVYAASLRALSIKTGDLDVTGTLSTAGDHIRMGFDAIGSQLHGILITDDQTTPRRRVEMGELGLGGDEYGLRVRNQAGVITFDSSAAETFIADLFIAGKIIISSATGSEITNQDGDFVIDKDGFSNANNDFFLNKDGLTMRLPIISTFGTGPTDLTWRDEPNSGRVGSVSAFGQNDDVHIRMRAEANGSGLADVELVGFNQALDISEVHIGTAGLTATSEVSLLLSTPGNSITLARNADMNIACATRFEVDVTGTLPVIDLATNGAVLSRMIIADSGISLNNPSGDISFGLTGAPKVWVAGSAAALAFFGTAPILKPTGVGVDAASIHAALTALGLIQA